MKKTILTAFVFFVIFGFAISGAVAQTWTWQYAPVMSTPRITELVANPAADELFALSAGSIALVERGTTGTVHPQII